MPRAKLRQPAPKPFPKTIFITWEEDGDGDTYLAVTDPADLSRFDETTDCAVYDLAHAKGQITVSRAFGWKKK